MTKKKKLPEQTAIYNYWAMTEKDPSPPGHHDPRATNRMWQQQDRSEQRWHREGGRRERERVGAPVSLRRVTVPPGDPSHAGNTFVERQRRRRERAQSSTRSDGQTQYVARTLAQTGTRAPSGRAPLVRPPVPSQQSPVPTRSGQQKPKRNRIWRLLGILTVMAITIMLSDFVLTSEVFRIGKVRVIGTHNDALIKRIQKMGIQGQNIFLLDVTGLTSKMDAWSEVDTADLSKQWPDQLVISIQERVPVVLWQTAKGTFSVDSQGMVIAPIGNTAEENHLSRVINLSSSQQGQQTNTNKSRGPLRPGTWINKTDVAFVVATLKQLPIVTGKPADSYKLYYDGTMYSSINRTSEEGTESNGSYIIENFVENWKAYLGSASDPNPLSNRLLELRSILDLAQEQQLSVATIDLRYGLHPVFTLH
jgi:hypothetical protein